MCTVVRISLYQIFSDFLLQFSKILTPLLENVKANKFILGRLGEN